MERINMAPHENEQTAMELKTARQYAQQRHKQMIAAVRYYPYWQWIARDDRGCFCSVLDGKVFHWQLAAGKMATTRRGWQLFLPDRHMHVKAARRLAPQTTFFGRIN